MSYIDNLYKAILDDGDFNECRDGSIYYDDYLYCSPLWDLYGNGVDDIPNDNNIRIYLQKSDEYGNMLVDDVIDFYITFDLETDVQKFKEQVQTYVDTQL